jgi:hypothetical protein
MCHNFLIGNIYLPLLKVLTSNKQGYNYSANIIRTIEN